MSELVLSQSPLRDTLLAMSDFCTRHSVDSPRLSAEILLAEALGLSRDQLLKLLILEPNVLVEPFALERALSYVNRRAKGEPAAYILGRKEFYGRDFSVTAATLIPRPETELLIDLSLSYAQRLGGDGRRIFADFGTGSGCVAVTLALELPEFWRGVAFDISSQALKIAASNAEQLTAHSLYFVLADFATPPLAANSVSVLVSNPPYISEAEYAVLDKEVIQYEPKSALVPTRPAPCLATGLEDALRIVEQAQTVLIPEGILLMEIGYTQGGEILAAMASAAWQKAEIIRDYSGRNRVISAVKAD